MIKALFLREWRLCWRRLIDIGLSLGFLLIAASLFPIAVGPEPARLALMSGGVVWVLALFTVTMSLDRLFQQDHEDGILAQLLLSPAPMVLVVLMKALMHWLSTALPLIIIMPFVALMLNFPSDGYVDLMVGLLLATPSLSLIGTMGAALTLGSRRSALILILLVLPLYIPILIFAVTGLEAALSGFSTKVHYLILSAMFSFALILCPLASATALKLHQE